MNRLFSDDPEKRKFIINELKQYTDAGDMARLASSLNSVLVTPQQRALLNDIKPFIPLKQQPLFDHLTSLHNSSTIFNKAPEPAEPVASRESFLQPDSFLSPLDDVRSDRQPSVHMQPAAAGKATFFKVAPLVQPGNTGRRCVWIIDVYLRLVHFDVHLIVFFVQAIAYQTRPQRALWVYAEGRQACSCWLRESQLAGSKGRPLAERRHLEHKWSKRRG